MAKNFQSQKYCFRNQLIRKQTELEHFLKIETDQEDLNSECQYGDLDNVIIIEDDELIEEALEPTSSEMASIADAESSNEMENYEDIPYLNYETIENVNEETDISRTQKSSQTPKLQMHRTEEIKYEEVKPRLVLTPEFLKAREGLKKLSKNCVPNEFLSEKMVSDCDEKNLFICKDSECGATFSTEDEIQLHLDDHQRLSDQPSSASIAQCISSHDTII